MTPANRDRLDAAWRRALAGTDASSDEVERVLERLRRRYDEQHRHYHDLEHIDEVLAAVDELADLVADRTAVDLAVAYHDAIYEPRSSTNEADSARLADDELRSLGLGHDLVVRVADLVRATADHALAAGDRGALSDADLWILAAPPDRYRRYIAGVRAEYGHLDDDAWRAGRGRFLDDLLARPRLYSTDRFHERFDERARRNLAGERALLDG